MMFALFEEVLHTAVEQCVCLLHDSAMAKWFQEGNACDEMAYGVGCLFEHFSALRRARRQRK